MTLHYKTTTLYHDKWQSRENGGGGCHNSNICTVGWKTLVVGASDTWMGPGDQLTGFIFVKNILNFLSHEWNISNIWWQTIGYISSIIYCLYRELGGDAESKPPQGDGAHHDRHRLGQNPTETGTAIYTGGTSLCLSVRPFVTVCRQVKKINSLPRLSYCWVISPDYSKKVHSWR